MSLDDIMTFLDSAVYPRLITAAQGIIASDKFIDDIEMMIDDYLQFSLLDDVEIPDDVLEAIRLEVLDGWDKELAERTLGWIEKHRQKAAA